MARVNRIVSLAFTVGLSSISATLLAHPSQPTGPFDSTAPGSATERLIADGVVHLKVSVCDHAHAGTAAIGLGEPIAATVYRRAGVVIDWTNGCEYDDPPDLQINLLPDRMTPRAFLQLNVFGFAGSNQTVANVMWERIEKAAIEHRMAGGYLLGFVMAHELGHLLLPPNAHRWSGVMQPDIDFHGVQLRNLWFSREQAALILRKVQSIADHRRNSIAVASN
jgi:hypothetical protein